MAHWIGKAFLFTTGCIALAATRLVSPDTAEYLVGSFGYYFVAITFVAWAGLGFSILRDKRLKSFSSKRILKILALVGAATYISLALEPAEFKVVMDEPLLAATAQSMHHDRMALVAARGVDVNGYYNLLDGSVDKRPLLYPFLVSILHDLSGYRVSNSFLLNALCTPFFWLLIWSLGHSIRSRDSDGYLSVVLLATAPLVANLATSGGFDWIHGCLLVFLFWIAQQFNRNPESVKLQACLIATLGLLANTRYEGLLWAIPFGALVIVRSGGLKAIPRLSWMAMYSPWMVLMPFLHRGIDNESTWQAGPDGRMEKFSPDYVIENIRSAFQYFLDMEPRTTASTLLFVVGVAGMIGLLVATIKTLISLGSDARKALIRRNAFWVCFGLGTLLHTTLLMFFNWGFFQEYSVARLSFPLQISFAVLGTFGIVRAPRQTFTAMIATGCGFIAYHFIDLDVTGFLDTGLHRLLFTIGAILGLLFWILRRPTQFAQGVSILAVVYLGVWTAPQIARYPYIGTHYPDRVKFDFVHRFVDEHKDERLLFISGLPYLSILKEVASLVPDQFTSNIELARERIHNQHAYASVYYFQVFAYDLESKSWRTVHKILDHPELELELLETEFLGISMEARIYRVIIKPKEVSPVDETP